MVSPDVLMVSPDVLMVSPRCTEHTLYRVVTETDQRYILLVYARFEDIWTGENERQLSGNDAICEYELTEANQKANTARVCQIRRCLNQ